MMVSSISRQPKPISRGRIRPRGLTGHLAAVALIFVASTGCNSHETARRTASSASPLNTSEISSEALPIESVLVASAQDKATIRKVIDHLTAQCMSAQGYEHIPYPAEPYASPLALSRRYGAITVEQARELGYQDPTFPEWRQFYADMARVDEQRPSDLKYQVTLYGTGEINAAGAIDRGCDGQATAKIYGSSGGLSEMPGYQEVIQMQSDSGAELYTSEAGKAAMSSWSECMKTAGYDFANWWDARQAYPHAIEEPAPTGDDEKRTAERDATCREKSDLERVLFENEVKILSGIMEERSETVLSFRTRLAQAVDNASDLLNELELQGPLK